MSPDIQVLKLSPLLSTGQQRTFVREVTGAGICRKPARDRRVGPSYDLLRWGVKSFLLTALLVASVMPFFAVPAKGAMVQAPLRTGLSSPSVNMTTIGRGLETSVAVNPTNPSNVIVTGTGIFDGDHGGFVYVSFDGGRTWRFGNTSLSYISSVIRGGWVLFDPVGTFSASGDAYVGTLQYGIAGSPVNSLFKSTDGGNSFLLTGPFLKMNDSLLFYNNNRMVHPCNQNRGPFRDYPAVIADPYSTSPYRNNVYVLVRTAAQIDPATCAWGVALERSTDGGETWGSGTWFAETQISLLSDNRGMAVAPDGTVFLAGLGGNCLYLTNCLSYTCPPTESGAVGVVLKSTDGGASFSQPRCAVDDPHIGLDSMEIAAASASNIYVLFLGDNVTQNIAPNIHLYSVASHDGGSSWSSIARVDDFTSPDRGHVGSAGAGPLMWDLSLSQQTGRLDVAWFDDRNQGRNYTLADIYYSYSYDAISWATNIRATPDGPYYMCTQSTNFCLGTGNDFMWVASSYTPGSDKAYIVASLGKAPCGSLCSALLTRFVTVTFPTPSLRTSIFYTDSSLSPLRLDGSGNSIVNVLLARGIVESTSPRQVLAWVNVTNAGSMPLQSLVLDETMPADWSISPPWLPAKARVHVYYANGTSLASNPEITQPSTITVSQDSPSLVHLTISNLTATIIGHPLMPGESILVSIRLSYGLVRTSQSPASYPRDYTDMANVAAWSQPYYTGTEASTSTSDSFTAYARIVGGSKWPGDTILITVRKYTIT